LTCIRIRLLHSFYVFLFQSVVAWSLFSNLPAAFLA